MRICESPQKIESPNRKSATCKIRWSANHKSANFYICVRSANLLENSRPQICEFAVCRTKHHITFRDTTSLFVSVLRPLQYIKLTCGRKSIACLMYTSRCKSGGGCSSADRRGSPCPPGPRRAAQPRFAAGTRRGRWVRVVRLRPPPWPPRCPPPQCR